MGARLREAREEADTSVMEAVAHLGVNRQTLYRWEWGLYEPPLAALRALAELYGTTVGRLANGERCSARCA